MIWTWTDPKNLPRLFRDQQNSSKQATKGHLTAWRKDTSMMFFQVSTSICWHKLSPLSIMTQDLLSTSPPLHLQTNLEVQVLCGNWNKTEPKSLDATVITTETTGKNNDYDSDNHQPNLQTLTQATSQNWFLNHFQLEGPKTHCPPSNSAPQGLLEFGSVPSDTGNWVNFATFAA